MLNSITSPLDGIRSPFGAIRNPFAAYAIGGQTPQTIADFEADKYRADGTTSTVASLLTHTRSGNAVQVADDGTLQWAGHNLLTYSEDFSNAAWAKNRASVSLADNGYFNLIQNDEVFSGGVAQNITISASATQTISFEAKAGTADFVFVREVLLDGSVNNTWFNLSTGAVGQTDAGHTASMTPLDDGSYLCSISFTNDGTSRTGLVTIFVSFADGSTASSVEDNGKTVLIRKPRAYRSDLGGMADIPTSYRGLSSSNTYLPTTSAARYLPRVGNHIWDGSSWVKRCLVEPQSTNLITYSEDFKDASWAKTKANVAGTAQGPDGLSASATILSDDSSTGTGVVFISDAVTTATSTAYTFSAFLKADQLSWAVLQVNNVSSSGSGSLARTYFNIDSGDVGAVGADIDIGARVEDAGNGWYRCSVSFTSNASVTSGNVLILVSDGNNDITVDLDGTSSVLIYGAQLEASSVPTSYIPTAGAQVTRPADALSIDSTLLPYDSTAMTIAMEYNVTGDDGTLFNWEADANNKITASAASGAYTFTQTAAGTSDSVTGGTLADGTNTAASVASRHTDGDINAAIDGTALTVNSTVTALADLSASDFVIAPNTAINIETIRVLGGYGATDAELEAATT